VPRRSMPRRTEGPHVAGVILAAGASRRMGAGRNKMLLQLEGESLLRRAARRAVAAGLSPVVVVLGHEADRARAELKGLSCDSVVNPDFTGPTSGSLHKGLEQLGSDVLAAVVMLGDMVLVTEQMLSGLVAAARGTEAPLVVSRYGDVTAPPLLFRRALFGELLAWSGEGCGKARLPLFQRPGPVLLQQTRQGPIREHPPAGLTRGTIVHLVFGVADPLDRRAAHRTRLAIPAVHRHLLAERRDSLGETVPRRFAQALDPGAQRVLRGVVEPFDFLCRELGGQLE